MTDSWQLLIRHAISRNLSLVNQAIIAKNFGIDLELSAALPTEEGLENIYHKLARVSPREAKEFRQAVVRLLKDYTPREDDAYTLKVLLHLAINLHIDEAAMWMYGHVYKRKYEGVRTRNSTVYREILAAFVDYLVEASLQADDKRIAVLLIRDMEHADTTFLAFRGLWQLGPGNFFRYFRKCVGVSRSDENSEPLQLSIIRFIRTYGWSTFVREWKQSRDEDLFDNNVLLCKVLHVLKYDIVPPSEMEKEDDDAIIMDNTLDIPKRITEIPHDLVREFLEWREQKNNVPEQSQEIGRVIDSLIRSIPRERG